MNRRTSVILMRLLFAAVLAVFLGIAPGLRAQNNGNGQGNGNKVGLSDCIIAGKHIKNCSPGQLKQAAREAARLNAAPQKTGVSVQFAGVNTATVTMSPLAPVTALGAGATTAALTNFGPPDYFGVPNYANSPLPTISATGTLSGGMQKFADALPGLCTIGTTNGGANGLGQCIPLALPDITSFPGSDFYRIGVKEYTKPMHSSLLATPTNLRGYIQLDATNSIPAGATPQYLGPLIVATRNRATRVLFKNMLSTDLNIPVDTTYMGAGAVSDLTHTNVMASQKRATLHLHGGNTPWISDGTTHQWITPAGGDGQPLFPGFAKGYSAMNVPDMLSLTPNTLGDGMQTFYWTNQQSGRLLWYHDHAYGLTRLNAYDGEAAGLLLVDPLQESILAAATVPGTIVTGATPTAANPLGIVSADLAHLIPLIIQDKTFVPGPTQLAAEDPTWDVANWGGLGSLWYPHVYTPNQNPADISGANGFGRWDWGPWFFPPQSTATLLLPDYACTSKATPAPTTTYPQGWAFPPLMCPGVPDPSRPGAAASPSGVPEGFMDTPVINGTAYPTKTVDPTAYRFQLLNGANDRTWNLGLYVADPLAISITAGGSGYAPPPAAPPAVTIGCASAVGTATVDANGVVIGITVAPATVGVPISCTPPVSVVIAGPTAVPLPATAKPAYAIASVNTEVKMVPAVPAASRVGLPNCPTSQMPAMAGGGLVSAILDATGKPINNTGLPAGCWPLYNSVMGFTAGPLGENGALSWGNSDGRLGGVPDPTTAGPPIIQIGSEGGLLPAPVVIPSTPVSYDYNKRSITVLNVLNHGLLVGGAERADFIVDFSAFAGKTLILYNDAPAPVPAGDPRLDYFTNDPDSSPTGGAPTTMAGYGPNTRTVMQIVVNPTCAGGTCPAALNLNAVTTAIMGTTTVAGLFAATQDAVIVPEPGYPLGAGGGPAEYGRIQDTSLTLNAVSPLCPAPPCAFAMEPKAIQELFTLDYGRMNATLGVELKFVNFTNQTTIPYGYADPPTEIFKEGQTQIWKITHNGVDTHFIHFHLFTVQVINRVGWDGAIKPPDPNELSFKDTVRMNPLEDVIVALKPMRQDFTGVSWGASIPNSVRPLNVTAAVGTTDTRAYTNVDPTNAPANVINDNVNFGWEYVWHCHILGHEENDMMRGMILAVAPGVPVPTALPATTGVGVNLTWTEATNNATSFTIQRTPAFAAGPTVTVGISPLAYTDTAVTEGTSYSYQMFASNLVGYTRLPATAYPNVSADSALSGATTVITPLNAPTNLVATGLSATSVRLSWTNNSAKQTGFTVQSAAAAGGPWTTIATVAASPYTATVAAGSTNYFQVFANGAAPVPNSAPSSPVVAGPPALAPSALAASQPGTKLSGPVVLNWTDNSPNVPSPPNAVAETSFTVQRATTAAGPWTTIATVAAHAGTGPMTYSDSTTKRTTTYIYRVLANNVLGSSTPTVSNSITTR